MRRPASALLSICYYLLVTITSTAWASSNFRSINAVTLATADMAASVTFYQNLGLNLTYGGTDSNFSTLGADITENIFHVNLFAVSLAALPPTNNPLYGRTGWNGWGRAIFYVTSVDALYAQLLSRALKPEAPPTDAPWGERYFQILDPMGHELSFAMPI